MLIIKYKNDFKITFNKYLNCYNIYFINKLDIDIFINIKAGK